MLLAPPFSSGTFFFLNEKTILSCIRLTSVMEIRGICSFQYKRECIRKTGSANNLLQKKTEKKARKRRTYQEEDKDEEEDDDEEQ